MAEAVAANSVNASGRMLARIPKEARGVEATAGQKMVREMACKQQETDNEKVSRRKDFVKE